MPEATHFRPDLYRGISGYYDRFRAPYPQALFDELLRLAAPSGQGRLMDLACGTGQITFAIADRFAEVWAVDQEPDMIEVVQEKARAATLGHVRATVGRAEGLDVPPHAFELVTIGNAFHRVHREAVAASARRWLIPGGNFALLWSDVPWAGEEAWQRALAGLIEAWKTKVGTHTRVPADWNQARREKPDTAVLTGAGFQSVSYARFPTHHEWTADELIGFVYSTSVLSRAVLGTHASAFERDLRRELSEHAIGNRLQETIDFACEVARRPA